ncbi:alpha/beta hydrolase [Catenuloplanes atrovinosus]|uniref:Acetyl esterase n=1 Tax=Catenuloplanes atrovinosus TaxID=137266 RepID=A0AAE3YSW0_9ACTN|nr:alpha/beta hydrolase [Catenuloplanes atrovinosus]MDR7277236.1 acetyl esterase [Catenuloplanes atrovinosus]
MTPRDRLQWLLMHGVLALPAPVKRRLAGPAVTEGPAPLDLDAHLLITMTGRAGYRLVVEDSAPASRAALRAGANALRGRRLPVTATPITVDGIAARLHTPRASPAPGPLLLFLHGGGWAIGDLDVYDYPARFLAHHAGIRVLSIDYRLAPEHPYPAGLDDAATAFDWAVRNAHTLGADPHRIAVGGDSAGATLAAALSHRLSDRPGPRPVFQMLLYPATDLHGSTPSRRQFADGYLLTHADIQWLYDAYAGSTPRTDPGLSVRYADPAGGLPPTYLATAGYDPLRDEGQAYAAALAAHGVTVEHARFDGLVHGYLAFAGLSRPFRQAALHAAHALRDGVQ